MVLRKKLLVAALALGAAFPVALEAQSPRSRRVIARGRNPTITRPYTDYRWGYHGYLGHGPSRDPRSRLLPLYSHGRIASSTVAVDVSTYYAGPYAGAFGRGCYTSSYSRHRAARIGGLGFDYRYRHGTRVGYGHGWGDGYGYGYGYGYGFDYGGCGDGWAGSYGYGYTGSSVYSIGGYRPALGFALPGSRGRLGAWAGVSGTERGVPWRVGLEDAIEARQSETSDSGAAEQRGAEGRR